MTNGLNIHAVKWLTYLVYGLIVVLVSITGSHSITLSKLPDNFVRLERYQADSSIQQANFARIEQGLRDINLKLDTLMMRQAGGTW